MVRLLVESWEYWSELMMACWKDELLVEMKVRWKVRHWVVLSGVQSVGLMGSWMAVLLAYDLAIVMAERKVG
jgi:hypothetical protein